jgi:hypothetical protein
MKVFIEGPRRTQALENLTAMDFDRDLWLLRYADDRQRYDLDGPLPERSNASSRPSRAGPASQRSETADRWSARQPAHRGEHKTKGNQ